MDRKIKIKTYTHSDKPWRQRWLYQLADIGIVKAIMLVWAICIVFIVISLLMVKAVLLQFK